MLAGHVLVTLTGLGVTGPTAGADIIASCLWVCCGGFLLMKVLTCVIQAQVLVRLLGIY